ARGGGEALVVEFVVGVDALIVDEPVSAGFFDRVPAAAEIYPLSLHDALPISGSATTGSRRSASSGHAPTATIPARCTSTRRDGRDRKSTRLKSSHRTISYAVFCLKKKNNVHVAEAQSRAPGGVRAGCRSRARS